jgi:flagellin-like hook-associated protein FlgL
MAGITPIPTTRVGNFFVRQRLVNQIQTDQLDLFRLQTQVSTGRRITRPSDDAPSALRAIALQRTIQRKEQSERNLAGSRSVLEVAGTSLNSVADILRDIRGLAQENVNSTSSAESRQAAISAIDEAINSLITAGNANYNGRYLFSGSRTNEVPFSQQGQYVEYTGNEKSLQNYVDLEQLFTTNLPGTEVFGGISGEVRGSADVNPQLTENTLLTSINGGNGLNTNAALSINVTNGPLTTSSIVDLSGAVTIGDVIRRIEANPPAGGANIRVSIVDNGLTVTTSAGTVRISEVAAGRAAKELGIFTPTSAIPGPAQVGTDLDPVVRLTTQLSDLFGIKSTGRLVSTNANNDIAIRAAVNGIDFNGVAVAYVTGGVAGSETASYDSMTKTLTVQIEDGESTANGVIAAINAEGTFTAQLDRRDETSVALAGTGNVNIQPFGVVTTGGDGESLDTASGLILHNGGDPVTLDISSAETVEDLFNLISGAGVGLSASINAEQNGINVRSIRSGADFTIGENGGTTATQLGIRTYTGETALADFNRGVGVDTSDTLPALDPTKLDSLSIVARDGTPLTVNLAGANSLQDVVNLINGAPGNGVGTTSVTASLNQFGSGIELVDSSTPISGALTVQNPFGTTAAEYLGLVLPGQTQVESPTPLPGEDSVLSGGEVVDNDLTITARSGTQIWVDLTGAATVQDVINRIDFAAAEAGVALTARLATTGNGIELVDASAGVSTLSVAGVEGSQAAELLGFLPNGTVSVDGSGNQILTSADHHSFEVDSVYNSLIRLRTALQNGDPVAIGEAVERIDVDLNRVTFARGEIGTRLQTLDAVETRLEDENVQLRSALSNEIDVDLVEAISNLTARQYALQASLQMSASILNLSILDYL